MRTSKKGFMVFIGLLVLLFLSILCVSRSYNKSLKVKTLSGSDKILNEQNLMLVNNNIISFPPQGYNDEYRIAATRAYILNTNKIINLDIKKQGHKVILSNKDHLYKPKTSMTVPINIYYTLEEKSGLVLVKFQDYQGREYRGSVYDKDIRSSAKSEDLKIHRVEKYKGNYYLALSYYNKDKKSSILAFARLDNNRLIILDQVEDKIKYRWARYGLIAFDKFFIFDYSDENGKFMPSTLSFDFKDKKISRDYIDKTNPLYSVFDRNPNNSDKTDNFSYIKYLADKQAIVRVKNPDNSNNYHVYIVKFRDGKLVLDQDIDTGIGLYLDEKKIQDRGNNYSFNNSNEVNIFLNNNKLIFYMVNSSSLMDSQHYEKSVNLDQLKRILIYGLDTRKLDYEGQISGALKKYDQEIYSSNKIDKTK